MWHINYQYVKFVHQIWDSVQKPEVYKEAELSEFFNVGEWIFWNEAVMFQLTYIFCNIKVEVTALSSYEDKEELFKEQVDCMFIHSS